MSDDLSLREEIVRTARALTAQRLNTGAAGNVSVRAGDDRFLITPTGMPADALISADMVTMGLDGTPNGTRRPSSEWRFHRDVYEARPDAGAIIHTHAPFATSLACLRREIPPFHYMIARFGGDTIRCAGYATFGTQALSDHVVSALADRCACLMASHGMLVFGHSLNHALDLAVELEVLCEQYWRALQVGNPVLLNTEEMATVMARFHTYGQQRGT